MDTEVVRRKAKNINVIIMDHHCPLSLLVEDIFLKKLFISCLELGLTFVVSDSKGYSEVPHKSGLCTTS